jgi:hypothetical protein
MFFSLFCVSHCEVISSFGRWSIHQHLDWQDANGKRIRNSQLLIFIIFDYLLLCFSFSFSLVQCWTVLFHDTFVEVCKMCECFSLLTVLFHFSGWQQKFCNHSFFGLKWSSIRQGNSMMLSSTVTLSFKVFAFIIHLCMLFFLILTEFLCGNNNWQRLDRYFKWFPLQVCGQQHQFQSITLLVLFRLFVCSLLLLCYTFEVSR